MILAERLQTAMTSHGLSQSELARRAGITQTTVRRLLTGGYGSKYLHRIAREVGASPAYLTGETDDPCEDAPTEPVLDSDTRELIECFDQLDQRGRAALLHVARSMTGRLPGTVHAPAPEFRGEAANFDRGAR